MHQPVNGGFLRAANTVTATNSIANYQASKEDIAFEDLGINDEREAQSLCGVVLSRLGTVPDFMACDCHLNLLQRTVTFLCSTDYCFDSFPRIQPGTCIVPSYEGQVHLLGMELTSKVCNDPMTLTYSAPLNQTIGVNLPRICATGEHGGTRWNRLTSCQFDIGSYECPCEVCESGSHATIDCTGASVLGVLRPFAKFECIGLSMIGSSSGSQALLPFVNPVIRLAMGVDEV